jgi:preprotein translocase subunit SecE
VCLEIANCKKTLTHHHYSNSIQNNLIIIAKKLSTSGGTQIISPEISHAEITHFHPHKKTTNRLRTKNFVKIIRVWRALLARKKSPFLRNASATLSNSHRTHQLLQIDLDSERIHLFLEYHVFQVFCRFMVVVVGALNYTVQRKKNFFNTFSPLCAVFRCVEWVKTPKFGMSTIIIIIIIIILTIIIIGVLSTQAIYSRIIKIQKDN